MSLDNIHGIGYCALDDARAFANWPSAHARGSDTLGGKPQRIVSVALVGEVDVINLAHGANRGFVVYR